MKPEPSSAVFGVSIDVQGGLARASLWGELDIAAVSTLERALAEIEDARPTRIVVDLRGLTFMDAMGLGVILATNERARADGADLALIPGEVSVQRLFSITHTAAKLKFVEPDSRHLASATS